MDSQTETGSGLTTNAAPFIEQAKRDGQLYISQPYELYSEENQEAWRKLYARMLPRWERYANEHFLKGIRSLCLDPDRVPRLEDVNRFSASAHRISSQSGQRLYSRVSVFRLPAQPRIPHHHHHPPLRPARLSAGAGYFPRHRRPRAHAHRQTFRRDAGAIRRVRAHGRGSGLRNPGPGDARALPHQHHQGDGAIFLVHHRVRPDARPRRR